MPTREFVWRRWEVGLAFLALTVIFTVLLIWQAGTANETHRTAARAEKLAVQNRDLLRIIVANRRETVDRIHLEQVRSCTSRHRLYLVLHSTVARGLASARKALHGPLATLPGVRQVELDSIASSKQFLRDLRGADCTGVPPVRVRPKPKPTP